MARWMNGSAALRKPPVGGRGEITASGGGIGPAGRSTAEGGGTAPMVTASSERLRRTMSSEIVYCGGGKVAGVAAGAVVGETGGLEGMDGADGGDEIGVGASATAGRVVAGIAIRIETAPVGSTDSLLAAMEVGVEVTIGRGAMPISGMDGSRLLVPTLDAAGETPRPPGGTGFQSIRSDPAGTTAGSATCGS